MKCIICKQKIESHQTTVDTPHGTLHYQGCYAYYKDQFENSKLNESDLSSKIEEVQLL
ncbi:hypothetical protein P19_0028 [Aeromonas phage P19]|uniref:Uncharacterized protein n=2 Tax=Caudoviricetes TaxID=2731619 RepID=A0A291LDI4_9CAUD|nr:hypothetical protein [Aeromonas phage AS-szw]UKM62516.1 hypothetical protein P19_0028 [Aeromonas phage P19]